MSAATVRNIAVSPGALSPIGIVYPTLAEEVIACHLKQCENCTRLFVTELGSGMRFCRTCKGAQLSQTVAQRWSQMRQLQAIGASYVERELHIKPRRTHRPARERLLEAFKAAPEGQLTRTQLTRFGYNIIFRMQRQGLNIVKVGERLSRGRRVALYALKD